MGKTTGFLEYARKGNPSETPLARIEHWNEFHPRLSKEERQRQAEAHLEEAAGIGRQSGIPLEKLVELLTLFYQEGP